MSNVKEEKRGEIILYKAKHGPQVEVRLEGETIWLDARQIALLFGTQRPSIVKHASNIYKTAELSPQATCSILEQVAADGKIRKITLYNLDAVISIGYRVNSKQATQFRIWATRILREHITKGFTINEKRLFEAKEKFAQLKETISFLQTQSQKKRFAGDGGDILSLLASYARTLTILDEYDKGTLVEAKGAKSAFVLTYEESKRVLAEVKRELIAKKEAGELFANEKDESFAGVIRGLYQTFGGEELYKTLERKAAHLLYFVIKDHAFSDGNKRSASFLFAYFLDRNNALYRESGEKKINDNALAALALLVAESDPKEKDQMIALITQLLQ